jgi:hypothetical protein
MTVDCPECRTSRPIWDHALELQGWRMAYDETVPSHVRPPSYVGRGTILTAVRGESTLNVRVEGNLRWKRKGSNLVNEGPLPSGTPFGDPHIVLLEVPYFHLTVDHAPDLKEEYFQNLQDIVHFPLGAG